MLTSEFAAAWSFVLKVRADKLLYLISLLTGSLSSSCRWCCTLFKWARLHWHLGEVHLFKCICVWLSNICFFQKVCSSWCSVLLLWKLGVFGMKTSLRWSGLKHVECSAVRVNRSTQQNLWLGLIPFPVFKSLHLSSCTLSIMHGQNDQGRILRPQPLNQAALREHHFIDIYGKKIKFSPQIRTLMLALT